MTDDAPLFSVVIDVFYLVPYGSSPMLYLSKELTNEMVLYIGRCCRVSLFLQ
jgi:hypothetical protein